jgi:tRNA(Ile)-lysidine synthase
MTGPDAAVAATRHAVRACLADLAPGSSVLVAVSGGADSMALAAATAFVAEREGLLAAAVVVDHQLQPGSQRVAREVAQNLSDLGFTSVVVRSVTVSPGAGPEASARDARYQAIDAVADELHVDAVLLGHTLDDQAESVLLGLARGSGGRSISGMSPVRGRYRRPLLSITRATTRQACDTENIAVWDDPHNVDVSFARVRVRQRVMPVIERELGPGMAEALARTAQLVRDDDRALEDWAAELTLKARVVDEAGAALDVEVMLGAPSAVRRRVIRALALSAGVPGGDLRASQVSDVDALLSRWKGQGPVHLPGGVRAWRSCGRLSIARSS